MFKKLIPVLIIVFLFGCATPTITEQIKSQTDDPVLIALATFADAQDLYIGAQQLYKPYQKVLQKTHPDIDQQIIENFQKANDILDKWDTLGSIDPANKISFRDFIKEITLAIAMNME